MRIHSADKRNKITTTVGEYMKNHNLTMSDMHRNCPCEQESPDECAICRDRNTVRNMFSIEDIQQAIRNEHPTIKKRILDALIENN